MSRKLLLVALSVVAVAIIYVTPAVAVDCSGIRGDVNNDGAITGADVTYLVNCLWLGGPNPPCIDQADINCNGKVFYDDIDFLILYLQGQYTIPCE
ncbi:MAG: dockerin type I domain-containing protein [Candidatus Zixiibacteriota bacterium]